MFISRIFFKEGPGSGGCRGGLTQPQDFKEKAKGPHSQSSETDDWKENKGCSWPTGLSAGSPGPGKYNFYLKANVIQRHSLVIASYLIYQIRLNKPNKALRTEAKEIIYLEAKKKMVGYVKGGQLYLGSLKEVRGNLTRWRIQQNGNEPWIPCCPLYTLASWWPW